MHAFSTIVGGQFYDIHINNEDNTNEADLSTDMCAAGFRIISISPKSLFPEFLNSGKGL